MRTHNPTSSGEHFQSLEPRRLLSFTPVGGESVVSGLDPSGGYAVAVAGDGNFMVVSLVVDSQSSAAAVGTLKAIRYTSAGQPIGSAVTLDSSVHADGFVPSVSMDADGDAVVTYLKNDDDAYLVRISKDGVASPPTLLTHSAWYVDVSMDDNGGYFVAHFGSVPILTVESFDAAGNQRAPAFFPDHLGLASSTGVDVEAKPDGSGAVIAYGLVGNSGVSARFIRVSPSGIIGEISNIEKGPNDAGDYADDPSVAVRPDGSFVIGYQRLDILQTSPWRTNELGYIQRYDANGVAQGAAIQAGTTGPVVDSLPDGGFVAAFVQGDALKAARFSGSGVLDPSGFVTVDTKPFDLFGLAADNSGNALIAYSQEKLTLPGYVAYGPLHYRRLAPEAEITLQNGVLSVFGTSASELITIKPQGANIIVTRGSTVKTFDASQVIALDVDGLAGDDTITNATFLKATLRGGEGNDTVYGGDGEDRLHGGIGNDSLWGRGGNDRIYGEDGRDSLYGNGGSDRIEGGAQPDHIRGNGGRDRLYGNGGHDRLYGGEAGDWLYAGRGSDQLLGEGGNDRLYADEADGGRDILRGNAGDDLLVARDSLIDHLFGDGGRDSSIADATDVLTSIEVRG